MKGPTVLVVTGLLLLAMAAEYGRLTAPVWERAAQVCGDLGITGAVIGMGRALGLRD
jgi:hypothetical protein